MKSQNAKTMPFVLVSPYPIPIRDSNPDITDVQGLPGPLSARDNGVLRTTGSYVMRNRVAPDVGDLEEVDIQAWDLRVDGIDPDAGAPTAAFIEFQAAPAVAAIQYQFNGTEFDRVRSAGAASLAADPVVGAQLFTQPGNWTINTAAAVGVKATVTRAAGAATERHIITSIHGSVTAGISNSLSVVLTVRDGVSGVGAFLFQGRLKCLIEDGHEISLGDLNILGSLATAVTIEFDIGAGGGTFEAVSLTGYTVG